MKEIKLNPIQNVMALIQTTFKDKTFDAEYVTLQMASQRILAEDLISEEFIPAFPKSSVDGYAIQFMDRPSKLTLVAKVNIGEALSHELKPGECIYVPTGGVIPKGADTMVMIEDTEILEHSTIQFKVKADSRAHIVEVGDDMKPKQVVLRKGTRLKPQHIGVLASLGHSKVNVLKKPKIFFISTGDELIGLDETLTYGKIREVNSYTLTSISEDMGFEVLGTQIVKDDYNLIKSEIKQALETADFIAISGGSSVGEKDYTFDLLQEIASEGVLISGMAIKPGKPTIIAKHGDKAIVGLPGHPVSSIVVFKLIAGEIMKTWGYEVRKDHKVTVKLSANIYAAQGRDTYQMVTLEQREDILLAHPTPGKSGMITLLSGSDGYVIIPKEVGVIEKGSVVEGYYFD